MLLQKEMIASYYQTLEVSKTQTSVKHAKDIETYSFSEILKKEILQKLSIVTPVERCSRLRVSFKKEYE